jgi:hypothetical protein
MTGPERGDCFRAAGRAVLNDPALTLVHGLVTSPGGGTARKGQRHWHAWCEGVTYDADTGRPVPLVVDLAGGRWAFVRTLRYYAMGEIKLSETWRYSQPEAIAQMREHGHWGPWVAPM